MDFSGKRVLITGSTMGIGRGAATMFLNSGATVGINGRNEAGVDRAVQELASPRAMAIPGDISTVGGCERLIDRSIEQLGGLDVLVNNAGICPLCYPLEVTEEHWDQVMAVNLRAALFCSKFALPHLRRTAGNIVMVASVAGLLAGPTDSFVYAISKGGLINMTRALAIELAPDGVRVNAICPGYIDTPMVQAENNATGGQVHEFIRRTTPLGRVGTVEECGSAILYLASSLASYCTGTIFSNDGGCSAAASWGGANASTNATEPTLYTPTPYSH